MSGNAGLELNWTKSDGSMIRVVMIEGLDFQAFHS
jgi:hypothetical protein